MLLPMFSSRGQHSPRQRWLVKDTLMILHYSSDNESDLFRVAVPVTGTRRKTRATREQRTAWQESKNRVRITILFPHCETHMWIVQHSG